MSTLTREQIAAIAAKANAGSGAGRGMPDVDPGTVTAARNTAAMARAVASAGGGDIATLPKVTIRAVKPKRRVYGR